MEREAIKELMELLGIQKIRDRTGWVSGSCPFAPYAPEHDDRKDDNPSFGISVGEGSMYNCFTCGRKGRLAVLPSTLALMTGHDCIQAREFISKFDTVGKTKHLKPILDALPATELTKFIMFGKGDLGPITTASIKLWNLRYDPQEKRLIFPIYDSFGRLVGIRGRSLQDNKNVAKYRTYVVQPKGGEAKAAGVWYGMQFELVPEKYLVLVEGERDAILLKQTGVSNVWGSMGIPPSKAQSESLKTVQNPVLIYTDNDKAGQKAALEIYKELRGYMPLFRIGNHYETKDPAEAVEKGIIYKILRTVERCG